MMASGGIKDNPFGRFDNIFCHPIHKIFWENLRTKKYVFKYIKISEMADWSYAHIIFLASFAS
jgi:hypothetical protein